MMRRAAMLGFSTQKMSIAGIVPGWLIGYLVREDEDTCEYRLLPVVSLIAGTSGSEADIEPVVMLPDGQTVRASDVGPRAFSAGPRDDAEKIAAAHAAERGRRVGAIA